MTSAAGEVTYLYNSHTLLSQHGQHGHTRVCSCTSYSWNNHCADRDFVNPVVWHVFSSMVVSRP